MGTTWKDANMPAEKIYNAILDLNSAISILLTPFFYIRRPQRARIAPQKMRQQWLLIMISNVIMVAVLLAIWYFWL